MKKRYFITLLITIVILGLTNHIWLENTSVNVGFPVNGNNNLFTQAILYETKDMSDKGFQSEFNKLAFNSNGKYSINYVYKIRFPKRLKIKFTTEDLEKFYIKDINIRDGKLYISDLQNFECENAICEFQQNKLSIKPVENNFSLIYKNPFKLRAHIKFNLGIFSVSAILVYALLYLIINYISNFKTIKNYSRLDVIFISLCCVILLLPMVCISDGETSIKEQRTLAVYKPLINKDGTVNYSFGQNFNEWFSDRFNGRNVAIDFYSSIKWYLNRYYDNSIAFYNKNTRWAGLKVEMVPVTYSKEIMDNVINNLQIFNIFCKQNNIKLYVLLVPSKNDISYKHSSPYITKSLGEIKNVAQIFNQNGIKTITPYDVLLKESQNEDLYYKTDHHWTDKGAYLGYRELMKEIKKDFPKINITDEAEYDIVPNKLIREFWTREFSFGNTLRVLNIPKNKHSDDFEDNYYYYTRKNQNLYTKTIDIPFTKEKIFVNSSDIAPIKAFLIGTSMSDNLTDFLPYSFKELRYINMLSVKKVPVEDEFKIMKLYKQKILDNKPQIIILCFAKGNFHTLQNIALEDN